MRTLFLIILAALIGFTQVIHHRGVDTTNRLPVVYWVADGSKYRRAQFDHLTNWLKHNDAPPFDLRIDPANMSANKVIVQGVTGTAGDIIQCYGNLVRFYAEIGILEDLDPIVREFGIDTNAYSPALKSLMYYDGKLVALPANSANGVFCVNMAALQKVGMDCPPERWDFDAFEKMGKEYVKRVQVGAARRNHFFAAGVHLPIMRTSIGITTFNETMTAPMLNQAPHAELLKRVRRWAYEDHILPTKADMESFNQEGDNFGGQSGLLHRGYFAMMVIGRWHFCTTRFMSTDVPYRCVSHPDGGFANQTISGRTMAMYKGSPRKHLAKHFFHWLASPEYSAYVAGDADGDPPLVRYLTNEEYLRPAKYTNEWEYNKTLAKLMPQQAIPEEISPFAVPGIYGPKVIKASESFTSGVISAEEAVAEMDRQVATAIRDHLNHHPELKARFDAAVAKQKEIDAIKASGKKVPLAMIDNPVLKRYHEVMDKLANL